ncbi:MAG: reverse transcriptase family protein [bacterium]
MDFIKIYSEQYFFNKILEGTDKEKLLEVISNKENYYEKNEIPKNNGKRIIYSIDNKSQLYKIQKYLVKYFLSKIPIADHVYGFVKDYSYKDFLLRHIYDKNDKINYYLRLDIQDFFGSINSDLIKETLDYYIKVNGTENENSIIEIINDIVTLENNLPQGAVTSPVVSNIVFRQLDIRLQKYCRKLDIKYSRYADDLLFSSTNSYLDTNNFLKKVSYIIKDKDFRLNYSKTIKDEDEISLNGFVVGNDIRLSRKRKKDISKILFLYGNKPDNQSFVNYLNKHEFLYRDKFGPNYFFDKDDLMNYLAGYRSFLIDWIPVKEGRHKEKHINLIDNVEVLLENLSDINNEYN